MFLNGRRVVVIRPDEEGAVDEVTVAANPARRVQVAARGVESVINQGGNQ